MSRVADRIGVAVGAPTEVRGGPVVSDHREHSMPRRDIADPDLEAMLSAAEVVTALAEMLSGGAGTDVERQRYIAQLCSCAEQLRTAACRHTAPDASLLTVGGHDHAARLAQWCRSRP